MIQRSQIRDNSEDAPGRPPEPYRPLHDLRLTHRPRYGPAFAVALLLVALTFWVVPEAWIRWLLSGRAPVEPVAVEVDPLAGQREVIRLIPVPSVVPDRPVTAERTDPVRERPSDTAKIEVVDEAGTEGAEIDWSWDPTTSYQVAQDLLAPPITGISLADSLARYAELLRRLTLTDLSWFDPADTTQFAQAMQRWHEIDLWYNRVWGPRWEAEGYSERMHDLYERAVLEAEREGQ